MHEWTLYDVSTGEIMALLSGPDYPTLDIGAGQSVIEGHHDQTTTYVDNNENPVVRPTMSLVISASDLGVNETLRIDNIPTGTTLTYPGPDGAPQAMIVDDGYIEWSSMESGEYRFELSNFPFLEEVLIATVSDV